MTPKEILKKLESLANRSISNHYVKAGAGDNHFGVKRGDVRTLAKQIKIDHELGLQLWETNNIDARFLAVLIFDPKSFAETELGKMVRSTTFVEVTDWFCNYIVKKHPAKEKLRQKWMKTKHKMVARCGWSLTWDEIKKDTGELDQSGLLDRIDNEMADAKEEIQWTMNFVLSEIGIRNSKLRKRAISIGERIGAFKDYPTSKGCVSPYAPICIEEMVKRQK